MKRNAKKDVIQVHAKVRAKQDVIQVQPKLEKICCVDVKTKNGPGHECCFGCNNPWILTAGIRHLYESNNIENQKQNKMEEEEET